MKNQRKVRYRTFQLRETRVVLAHDVAAPIVALVDPTRAARPPRADEVLGLPGHLLRLRDLS